MGHHWRKAPVDQNRYAEEDARPSDSHPDPTPWAQTHRIGAHLTLLALGLVGLAVAIAAVLHHFGVRL